MDGSRRRLAAAEAEFLRSLSTGGPYAPGSDLRGMRATSRILWAKRVRTMAKAWPELATLLGNRLNEHATQLLADIALPPGDHAVEDGLRLARHLEAAGPVPDSIRLRMLDVKLRYRRQRGHLVRRSRPAAGCIYMRQARRLIFAVRVPGLRLRSISIRARFAHAKHT